MKNNQSAISKLLKALNYKGEKILLRTKQFYSQKMDSPVTIYYIDKAYMDEDNPDKTKNAELFHSTSQLQIILFLRDLLYISEGKNLPDDNDVWNKKRKEINFYTNLENIDI